MYQSVMAKRQGSGSSGTGFGFALVEIKELRPEKNLCLAMDLQTGDYYDVALTKRGETAWPQVGDRWIMDRSLGHWMLQTKVTGSEPPAYTGHYNLMDPDLLRLVTLLKGLGLLKDATTTGTPPAKPVVTGTRNRIEPVVQTILDILDGAGVIDDQTSPQTLPIGVWQDVTSLNTPWENYSTNYQAARYMIDSHGFVSVEGLVKATASPVSGTSAVFNLPSGFRPPKHQLGPSFSSGGVLRQLQVHTNGDVQIANLAADTTIPYTSLNIRFSIST